MPRSSAYTVTGPLGEMSPVALAAAIEANQAALFATLARLWDADVAVQPDAAWFISGMPFPLFNGVLCSAFADDEAEARIAAVLHRFRERGVPMTWHVGPSARPANLGARLKAHGLWCDTVEPGMAVELARLPELPLPAGLTVEQVGDGSALDTWLRIVRGGFGLAPIATEAIGNALLRDGFGSAAAMRHFLGFLGGQPVASVSLFPAAGVAGIYNVATLNPGRRHGIGTAMTLAALRVARESGLRVGILQATEMGLGLYRRLGFQQYATLAQYVWFPLVAVRPAARGDR